MLAQCSKRPKTITNYEVINLGVQSKVRDIEVMGDSFILCGGDKGEKGFVATSDLQLTDFDLKAEKLRYPVYSAARFDSLWWFGLDRNTLFQSRELISFHEYYWDSTDWVGTEYQHPMREMEAFDEELYVVAGGKLSFGVVYGTSKPSLGWSPRQTEHELRALSSFSEGQEWAVWAGGNGVLFKKSSENQTWSTQSIPDIFIAGIYFQDFEHGLLVTYNGAFWKSENGGKSWSKLQNSRGVKAVNKLVVRDNRGIAVANNGRLAYTELARGSQWEWFQLEDEFDLTDAVLLNDQIIITADGGNMIRINVADLK